MFRLRKGIMELLLLRERVCPWNFCISDSRKQTIKIRYIKQKPRRIRMIINLVKDYLNDGTMRDNPLGGNIQF